MNSIGAILQIRPGSDIPEQFRAAKELGIESCQIGVWDPACYTDEVAAAVNGASRETGITVSLLWAGWTGPCVWNFTDGPDTLGLVPAAYRAHRLRELLQASDFAPKIGVTDIATHVGFLPENPTDGNYNGVVAALTYLCKIMKKRGQNFLFETGQETPVTLLRTIERIGTGNAFINFDTYNLICYGKGNPVDAMRVFGKYVRNVHIKDGFYPTDGTNLGHEVKVGEGLVDFQTIYAMLRAEGYEGPLTIEREISGAEQDRDIAATVVFLKDLMREYEETRK